MKCKEIIKNNPNILNKNCEIGHITGSGLVVDIQNKKVLLHKHKKLGIWLQFGGYTDYELQISEIALRESSEESGLLDLKLVSYLENIEIPIDVEIQTIEERQGKPKHIHLDFRYLLVTNTPNELLAAEGESSEFWWVSVEEALEQPESLISNPVKRLIIKAGNYFALCSK